MSSGIRNKPLYKARELLAASPTFQQLVATARGVEATAENAAAAIYLGEASDLLDDSGNPRAPRPRIIIRFAPDFTHTKLCPGAWRDEGSLSVSFEFETADTTAEHGENLLAFTALVGSIIRECDDLTGTGSINGESYLNAVVWTAEGVPESCNPQHENGREYWIDDYTLRFQG